MEQAFDNFYTSVDSRKAALKLAKELNEKGYETRIDPIGLERVDDRHFFDRGRYMVRVINNK